MNVLHCPVSAYAGVSCRCLRGSTLGSGATLVASKSKNEGARLSPSENDKTRTLIAHEHAGSSYDPSKVFGYTFSTNPIPNISDPSQNARVQLPPPRGGFRQCLPTHPTSFNMVLFCLSGGGILPAPHRRFRQIARGSLFSWICGCGTGRLQQVLLQLVCPCFVLDESFTKITLGRCPGDREPPLGKRSLYFSCCCIYSLVGHRL